jgi:hypothetical protein
LSAQHKELAAGRWKQLSFVEQMANIGSEIERFLNWRAKNQPEYSAKAFERALELIDLTLDANRQKGRLREVARVREILVDSSGVMRAYNSSDDSWRKYFLAFAQAARRRR